VCAAPLQGKARGTVDEVVPLTKDRSADRSADAVNGGAGTAATATATPVTRAEAELALQNLRKDRS
jgi:hypothetical protein